MSAVRVVLPSALNVYGAPDVQRELLQALDAGHGLELDAAVVGELDTAGVQVLLALAKEAALREVPLTLCRPSPRLAQALQLIGVAARFQIRSEASEGAAP